MKKRLFLALGLFNAFLLLGAAYVVTEVDSATTDLERLLTLHQVEILREHFLIEIKQVQSNLTLMGTPRQRPFQTVVLNTRNMGSMIDTCFDCHHSDEAVARLLDLKSRTLAYQDGLSRVMTIRANTERLVAESDAVFGLGEGLIDATRDMIAMTHAKLAGVTEHSLVRVGRTKHHLFLLVAAGPLLSALLAFAILSGLAGPLRVLLEGTRMLKAGQLDHRVAGLKDEFGELAASFNEMAASLKEQVSRMQRTEQMVVAGELATGLAHEIKNPLAGIKAAMQILGSEANLSQQDREVVSKVAREIVGLEALMKSFLNLTRPAKPQMTEVNVNTLIDTVLAFYARSRLTSPTAAGRVEISQELQPLPNTMADPKQLNQVFLNLVLNAIDAMPQGGTLTARTSFEKGLGIIHVEFWDTGKGISKENIDKIFHPFFTTKAKGTGLGLAISRTLIEQHGGSITGGANPKGGAVFRIRLPVRAPEAGLSV